MRSFFLGEKPRVVGSSPQIFSSVKRPFLLVLWISQLTLESILKQMEQKGENEALGRFSQFCNELRRKEIFFGHTY